MSDATVVKLLQPGSFADPLTEVLRNGARALLAQAVEAEVAEFLAKHADLKTAAGLRRVVRHGHLPEREVMTGIGPVGRAPTPRARPWRWRWCRAHPLHARDPAALCAALAQPGGADPDPLPEGPLDRRFRGGACRLARQGCTGPVGLDHRAAEGGLARRAQALAQARSVGQALRLRVGRRHLPAGPS